MSIALGARSCASLCLALATSLAGTVWAQQTTYDARDLSGVWARPAGGRYYEGRQEIPDRPESEWSGEKLPFTAAGRAAFDANIPTGGPRQVQSRLSPNDLRDQGNPLGLYRAIEYSGNGRSFEIGHLTGKIVQLLSVGRKWRTIYVDGRPVPDMIAAGPFWYGHSVGHWEDDTLVVTTVSLDERQWLDGWGTPISMEARVEERWQRIAADEITLSITVVDTEFYTKPWSSLSFSFVRQDVAIEPLEIIYAPVDVLRYHETILVPSADPTL